MHIGCCKNCRYLDLMEYESDECPRCGDTMVSLGITTLEWNRMTTEERNNVVSDRFPRGEDSIRAVERLWKKKKVEPYIFNLRAQLNSEQTPDQNEEIHEEPEETTGVVEKKLDIDKWLESQKMLEKHTKELPVIEPEDLFRAAAKRPKREETLETMTGFIEVTAGSFGLKEAGENDDVPDTEAAAVSGPEESGEVTAAQELPKEAQESYEETQEPPEEVHEFPEEEQGLTEEAQESFGVAQELPEEAKADPGPEDKEYIYACYMCNSITSYEEDQGPYHCDECGASMINTGCTRTKWSDMTKEQKRQTIEDAKIRHMVTAIRNSPFDDSDSEKTQSIINVVGNKDLA
ncbi:MAG: hypothetical protein K6E49_06735 [Lachnospiraceae bacterium]|nr:hypothetical protein [Lachnospiraceae bacterium]